MKNSMITLTTDFGNDFYVAQIALAIGRRSDCVDIVSRNGHRLQGVGPQRGYGAPHDSRIERSHRHVVAALTQIGWLGAPDSNEEVLIQRYSTGPVKES